MKLTEKQCEMLDKLIATQGKPGAARVLCVSRQTIYNVLAGKQGLSFEALAKLEATAKAEAPALRELEQVIVDELHKCTNEELRDILKHILLRNSE